MHVTEIEPRHFILEVAEGRVPGHSIVEVSGYASAVAAGIVPICTGKVYNTPTAPVALEFVSDSTDDDVAGTGARVIEYNGIDLNWDKVTNTFDTDGTTPVALPDDLLRLTDWHVRESGSYGDPLTASYAGNLAIREVATPLNVWSTIEAIAPFSAESEIGVYTIPVGHRAYLISKHIAVESGKTANTYLLRRENADSITAPYGVRRMIERDIGLVGSNSVVFEGLKGPYQGPCDIGFMGQAPSNTANISVEMDMLVIEDGYPSLL